MPAPPAAPGLRAAVGKGCRKRLGKPRDHGSAFVWLECPLCPSPAIRAANEELIYGDLTEPFVPSAAAQRPRPLPCPARTLWAVPGAGQSSQHSSSSRQGSARTGQSSQHGPSLGQGSARAGQSSLHSSHPGQERFSHCGKTESTKRNQFVRELVMSCCRAQPGAGDLPG